MRNHKKFHIPTYNFVRWVIKYFQHEWFWILTINDKIKVIKQNEPATMFSSKIFSSLNIDSFCEEGYSI